jgi:hypothetical protein
MADALRENTPIKLKIFQMEIVITDKSLQITTGNYLRVEKVYFIIKHFEKELKFNINSIQLKCNDRDKNFFNQKLDISQNFLTNIDNFKTFLNNNDLYKKISKKINKTGKS